MMDTCWQRKVWPRPKNGVDVSHKPKRSLALLFWPTLDGIEIILGWSTFGRGFFPSFSAVVFVPRFSGDFVIRLAKCSGGLNPGLEGSSLLAIFEGERKGSSP
jgi:hypothetical protein